MGQAGQPTIPGRHLGTLPCSTPQCSSLLQSDAFRHPVPGYTQYSPMGLLQHGLSTVWHFPPGAAVQSESSRQAAGKHPLTLNANDPASAQT